MWQGANRIAANLLMIDRDEQTLKAYGQVVSELVDTSSDSDPGPGGSAGSTRIHGSLRTGTLVSGRHACGELHGRCKTGAQLHDGNGEQTGKRS